MALLLYLPVVALLLWLTHRYVAPLGRGAMFVLVPLAFRFRRQGVAVGGGVWAGGPAVSDRAAAADARAARRGAAAERDHLRPLRADDSVAQGRAVLAAPPRVAAVESIHAV